MGFKERRVGRRLRVYLQMEVQPDKNNILERLIMFPHSIFVFTMSNMLISVSKTELSMPRKGIYLTRPQNSYMLVAFSSNGGYITFG